MTPHLPSGPAACVLSFLAAALPAQTNVGGSITANARWTLAGSPYVASAEVTVTAGAVLTIDPGVVVQLPATTGITVGSTSGGGTLIARGTVTSPIRFTRIGTGGDWRSIV